MRNQEYHSLISVFLKRVLNHDGTGLVQMRGYFIHPKAFLA